MATICLYGAASDRISDDYRDDVFSLGQEIAKRGHRMIYGAGASGLMGAAARGMDSVGGHIIGVTPHFMHDLEPVYPCTELINTETMAERKYIMEQQGEAFVIVPGGIGTFDEFFQVLTLKELGQLENKPIVLFNVDGYYNPLVDAIRYGFKRGFVRQYAMNAFQVCNTPDEVLSVIETALA